MDKVQAAADAAKTAKDAIPVVSQYPLAAALVAVFLLALVSIGLAGFVIWSQRKALDRNNTILDRQVTVNEKQAVTLEAQSKQIDHLPRIREYLAAVVTFLHAKGFNIAPISAMDEEKK